MDHGTLTDANGKSTDFRNTILLMTSNVGAREMASRRLGFAGESGRAPGWDGALPPDDDASARSRGADGDRAI